MTSLYRQIVDTIAKRIDNGEYLPNEKLPGERELAELYGVNRLTVKKAMNMLVEMGYIYRNVGQGTFVKNRTTMKKAMDMLVNKGYFSPRAEQLPLTQDAKNRRLLYLETPLLHSGSIGAQITSSDTKNNCKVFFSGFLRSWPTMCARLRISEDQSVFGLHRIRYNDGTPRSVEYSYIPSAYFEDAHEQNFNQVSLYDYMNSKGHMPINFEERLTIIHCPSRETKLLKLSEGEEVVFHFECLGRDASGQVVEYSHSYIKTSNMKFRFYQCKRSF